MDNNVGKAKEKEAPKGEGHGTIPGRITRYPSLLKGTEATHLSSLLGIGMIFLGGSNRGGKVGEDGRWAIHFGCLPWRGGLLDVVVKWNVVETYPTLLGSGMLAWAVAFPCPCEDRLGQLAYICVVVERLQVAAGYDYASAH